MSARPFDSKPAPAPFRAPRWLRNRHAQTVWSPFFRRSPRLPFRLERWPTPDGDLLRVHRLAGSGGAEAPTVLLLHGLEGSAESHYIPGQAARIHRLGWQVVVMEHRSCGGEMNRARRLYHSGETTDLAFVVSRLVAAGVERLYLSGVSLGGNQIGKWLGESVAEVPAAVRGAVIVSPPYDLTVSGPNLDRVLGGLYTRRFLRTLVPKALAKEAQYPGSMDRERIARARTFLEFDTWATAALHGFRDAEDYWARVGCGQFLPRVRVPLLLLSSADDPFNPGSTLPHRAARDSPFLVAGFTERGGHVGFVHGWPWRTRHWAEEQMEAFFRHLEEREQGARRPPSL